MKFNDIVVQNILRDKWTYISYFLSSVFSIVVFFLFSITAFHPMLALIDTQSTLGITMMFASFFIYIFSFIFIIYSIFAFLKKKTKSLGLFMITGASMKQIRTMIFRENMLIGGAAIVTAIIIGLIVSPLFLMVAKRVLQADLFGMYIPYTAIILTIILFTILFFVVSKFMARFINREEAIQLLKADVTTEKVIAFAPIKFMLSVIVSGFLIISAKFEMKWILAFDTFYYMALFASLLFAIYFTITQGTLLGIRILEKRPSYFRKTNMLFVSNIKAKGRSHAHLIYLLTVLLLGVFLCTSVLYSSYYSVKEKTEILYPYSFQYTSLPGNTTEENDIAFIEATIGKSGKFDSFYSAFKTDENRRIGFMSLSNYNALGLHEGITLNDNEYYVAAGNEGILPSTNAIEDYALGQLKYAGLEKQNILMTGFQNVYYIVPDAIYETIELPVYKVFAYELENWPEKIDIAETILEKIPSVQDAHLISSKIGLYDTEKFVKSIMFFIGFMLSLIFLSAAMSILYFYLQTSLEAEKEKYRGIRKIGLSVKDLSSVVTKELAMLVFIPFSFASILLLVVIFGMRNMISASFYQMTAIGIGVFLLLFILSFLMIRRGYLKKLNHE
ncbi:ABC transporter permease [Solibacillus sp. R5-41]|uniref:FtsX-like permease family protein n=1 Tax=Solibacillus sp. R5-41 TaxID=2048654 RepID=UPI000C129886|nr:FtsX-like permease family protein [Solibacillus sp. R5-41]ATP39898.1 ABC transporter permease [Solibacillus sp. R5-41]